MGGCAQGDCKVAFSGGMWRGFAAPEGKCIGFWRHSRQKPIHFFRFQSEALDFAVALRMRQGGYNVQGFARNRE
jgi:hypothetical protein